MYIFNIYYKIVRIYFCKYIKNGTPYICNTILAVVYVLQK